MDRRGGLKGGRFVRNVAFLIVIAIMVLVFQNQLLNINISENSSGMSFLVHRNYFLGADRLEEMDLLVNTTNCEIPDFSQWDQEIIHLIGKVAPFPGCMSYNWSYMDGNILVIKEQNMNQDGFSFQSGFCCYKIISRVQQPIDSYSKDADNLISYSSCISITNIKTEVNEEFIMVECSRMKYFSVLYRGFHANPLINNIKSTSKVNFWKERLIKNKEAELPPNILVIGLDSTSRNNFRRNMFKTLRRLESLDAVEMLGYTKVGSNTFPNFCPIMFGYSEEDMRKICYFNTSTKLDDCPSIWKRFDEANYLTGHTEDSPEFAIFNYLKTGFVQQPVNFYSRPIFLAATEYDPLIAMSDLLKPLTDSKLDKDTSSMPCLGYQTADEMILQYLNSTLTASYKNKAPIFTLSWSTSVSHNDHKGIQLLDDLYAEFLDRLESQGYLKNTILFFMGDHGYRYGPWRETLIGYYEDKLPNMWIRLPSQIRHKFPQWQEALEMNKRRLTSPFTLYWTLNLILDTFTSTKSPVDALDHSTGQSLPRKHRQSFFEPVPEDNRCQDVGVPDHFCACYPLSNVLLDNPMLIKAAEETVQIMNTNVISSNQDCLPLSMSKIVGGAVIDKTSDSGIKRYVVSFLTDPGEFLIEAEIDFFTGNKTFKSHTANLHRASKLNSQHVSCVNDPNLELFCYCK